MARPSSALFCCLLACIEAAVALSTPMLVARQRPIPTFSFNPIDDGIVCGAMLISWTYTGPDNTLSLSITNQGVDQHTSISTAPSHTLTDRSLHGHRRAPGPNLITINLPASIHPGDQAYVWGPANVPQGWYIVNADIPGVFLFSNSLPFFVRNTGNTTCFTAPITQPSTTSATITATSPSGTPSQTSLLPPANSASGHLNVGAIVGAVIGGVVVLVLIPLLCFLFVCRRRTVRALPRSRAAAFVKKPFGFGHAPRSASWNGLTSVDCQTIAAPPPVRSTDPVTRKPYSSTRHASHTESFATFVDPTGVPEPKFGSPTTQEDIEGYLSGSRSRRGSVAHQTWYAGSPSEEKFGGSVEEMELEGVPTLAKNYDMTGRSNFKHRSPSTSTFASELTAAPQRRPSVSSQPALPAIDTSMDISMSTAYVPSSSPPLRSQQQQRKPVRKPVPVYATDGDDLSHDLANESFFSSPATPGTPVAPAPSSQAFPPLSGPPNVAGNGGGHYSTRANANVRTSGKEKDQKRSKSKTRMGTAGASFESIVDAGSEFGHALSHKNSFGPGAVEGKPIHYLVPDILPHDRSLRS